MLLLALNCLSATGGIWAQPLSDLPSPNAEGTRKRAIKAWYLAGCLLDDITGSFLALHQEFVNPPSQESSAFTPGEEWRVLVWGRG